MNTNIHEAAYELYNTWHHTLMEMAIYETDIDEAYTSYKAWVLIERESPFEVDKGILQEQCLAALNKWKQKLGEEAVEICPYGS